MKGWMRMHMSEWDDVYVSMKGWMRGCIWMNERINEKIWMNEWKDKLENVNEWMSEWTGLTNCKLWSKYPGKVACR